VLNEKTLSQMGINGIQGKMLVLASRLDVRGCFPQIPTVMDIDFEHFIDLRRIKRQT
jgi:sulfur transfer complex TusBCD TusB component (DsrH family)